MIRAPLILISPSLDKKGDEFGDLSISLSETYQHAIMAAGGLPLALPALTSRELIAESVRRCDGVLLTGGEDVDPRLYGNGLPPRLRGTVTVTPDGGARDWRELVLIDEVSGFRTATVALLPDDCFDPIVTTENLVEEGSEVKDLRAVNRREDYALRLE